MNLLKHHQLAIVVAISATAITSSSLGLAKAEAATKNGFIQSDRPIRVTGEFRLVAHPVQMSPFETTVPFNTPLALSVSLGQEEIHGTRGNGSVNGTWGTVSGQYGLLWTLVANIAPGQADPELLVSFDTFATFRGEFQNIPNTDGGFASDIGVERVPEPTSTLSLLAFGTLGAASTLKRKLKSSKSSEKGTTKVS
jgi:hypothetical protein